MRADYGYMTGLGWYVDVFFGARWVERLTGFDSYAEAKEGFDAWKVQAPGTQVPLLNA